jgi:NADH-quinone oxidoreductase subunit I
MTMAAPQPVHAPDHTPDHAPPVLVQELTLQQKVQRLLRRVAIALYLPSIFQGMAHTFGYMFRPKFTEEYPEVKPQLRKGYRGEHRLKLDDQGRMKCVACFMCQTACPAECITIVAGEAPADWPDRDKIPVKFDIDLLKCIYCGMCEEACPCDAIELTPLFTQVATKREHKLHDINVLMGLKPPPGKDT